MRTEIDHDYKWGFFLPEQEIRRITQSCQEHAPKVGAGAGIAFTVKLKDGSVIESPVLDDILRLENGASKAITRLTVRCTDGLEPPRAFLSVQFEDGLRNPKTWDSVTVSVVGEARDAVFLAGAELDERVKKTRTRAWPYYVNRPWFFMLALLIGMALTLMAANFFSPTASAVDTLAKEHAAGRVANPIEAIILLERLKASPPITQSLLMAIMPFAVPLAVFGVAAALIPKVSLSYVFYWGDAIPFYDKRRSAYRIFWTVIVLGVVAALIAGLILRLL